MRRLPLMVIVLLVSYVCGMAQSNAQATKHDAPSGAEIKLPAQTSSSQAAENVVPVIDIRALALQSLEPAAGENQGMSISERSYLELRTIPLVVALLVSFVGTAAMMFMLGSPVSPKRTDMPERREVSAIDAILAQARLVLQEKTQGSSGRLAFESGAVEADDPALSLAKTFGRGQGEFRLLRKLESERQPYAWESKLKSTQQHHASARRLGVGRGEVRLAASLRRMEESQIRKESRV